MNQEQINWIVAKNRYPDEFIYIVPGSSYGVPPRAFVQQGIDQDVRCNFLQDVRWAGDLMRYFKISVVAPHQKGIPWKAHYKNCVGSGHGVMAAICDVIVKVHPYATPQDLDV